ncbi:MAG: autotransporter outer membrane beta-barrel domain-containing protein [Puniceicoccales bacterium]|nr:autotransporter outer membrane beta-barrel domain-containing protein [Puniceicoccales bacterium]
MLALPVAAYGEPVVYKNTLTISNPGTAESDGVHIFFTDSDIAEAADLGSGGSGLSGMYTISAPGDYSTQAIHCVEILGYTNTFAVEVKGSGWITFSAQNGASIHESDQSKSYHIFAHKWNKAWSPGGWPDSDRKTKAIDVSGRTGDVALIFEGEDFCMGAANGVHWLTTKTDESNTKQTALIHAGASNYKLDIHFDDGATLSSRTYIADDSPARANMLWGMSSIVGGSFDGLYGGECVCNDSVWDFGNGAFVENTSAGSVRAFVVAFGANWGVLECSDSTWQFGNNAVVRNLSACKWGGASAVFGQTACLVLTKNGETNSLFPTASQKRETSLCQDSLWHFGDNASLVSYARTGGFGMGNDNAASQDELSAVLFGLAGGGTFDCYSSEWSFGCNTRAMSYSDAYGGASMAAVLGAAAREVDEAAEVSLRCQGSLWSFGENARLTCYASSYTTLSWRVLAVLFGSTNGLSSSDTIWRLGNGAASLVLADSHMSNGWVSATGFGHARAVKAFDGTGMNAELIGSQDLAVLGRCSSSGLKTIGSGTDKLDRNAGVNAFGGPWTSGVNQVVFHAAENSQGAATVNILAAKLDGWGGIGDPTWNIDTVNGEDVATLKLHRNDEVGGEQVLPRAFALGGVFDIYVGGRKLEHSSYGGVQRLPVLYNGQDNILNVIGDIRRCESTSVTRANTSLTIENGWQMNCWGKVEDLTDVRVLEGVLRMKSDQEELQDRIREIGKKMSCAISSTTPTTVNPTIEDGKRTEALLGKGSIDYYCPDEEEFDNLGAFGERAGSCAIDPGDYEAYGKLTLDHGNQLRFGTAYLDGTIYSTGYVELEGDNYQSLVVNDGAKLGLDIISGGRLEEGAPICCHVVRTADVDCDDVIYGLTKGEKIGSTTYFAVEEEDSCLDRQISDYAIVSNLRLLWSDEPEARGLFIAAVQDGVVPTVNSDWIGGAQLEGSSYAKKTASGILARAAVFDTTMAHGVLLHRFTADCCGTPSLFCHVFHGHVHADEDRISGFGHRSDFHGLAFGGEQARQLFHGHLRFGLMGSYFHNQMDFYGRTVAQNGSKSGKRRDLCSTLFANYVWESAAALPQSVLLCLSSGAGHNILHRQDNYEDHFTAKFYDARLQLALDSSTALTSWHGVRIGPWAGLRYDCIHQGSYVESCADGFGNVFSMPAVNYNFFSGIVGVGMDSTACPSRAVACLRGSFRIGWQFSAMLHHVDGLASIYNRDFDTKLAYDPVVSMGKRHACLVSCNFGADFNGHLSLHGSWNGSFATDQTTNSFNLTLQYAF